MKTLHRERALNHTTISERANAESHSSLFWQIENWISGGQLQSPFQEISTGEQAFLCRDRTPSRNPHHPLDP